MLFARSALRLPRQAVRQLSAGGSQAEHIEGARLIARRRILRCPSLALARSGGPRST